MARIDGDAEALLSKSRRLEGWQNRISGVENASAWSV